MPNITNRLSVEGPDQDGEYELVVSGCGDCGEFDEAERLTRAEADALIAALNPWRDIASAPKDGTPILVYDGARIEVADWGEASVYADRRSGRGMKWCVGECDGEYNQRAHIQPTHWQPRPAPPSHEPERLSPAETQKRHLDTFGTGKDR